MALGAALALVVAGAGCKGKGEGTPAKPSPPGFDHAVHAAAEIECATCHTGATADEQAGLPTVEVCAECHEDGAKGAPALITLMYERKKGGAPEPWDRPLGPGKDVIFSHATHAKQSVACAECHGEMKDRHVVGPDDLPKMALCQQCHEERNEGRGEGLSDLTSCTTCHTKIRKDGKPESHLTLWKERHGGVVYEEGLEGETNCAMCHTESWCVTCHKDEKPKSHTGQWRETGHAVASAMDRQACETCHQTDYCVRCHTNTAPRNHTLTHWIYLYHGQNAKTDSDACATCHTGSYCVMCHKATKPLDHHGASWTKAHGQSAALDEERCANCHTVGTCIACHTERKPSNHTATWGDPTNTHCVGCHLPLASADQNCSGCHTTNPGHSGASPRPGWHVPGMDCRSCHGAGGAPMPHLDNGEMCQSCHQ